MTLEVVLKWMRGGQNLHAYNFLFIRLFFSIIQFIQDMKTNKPKLKTYRKTRLNIQLSQTLTMNVAHDIKILDMYL